MTDILRAKVFATSSPDDAPDLGRLRVGFVAVGSALAIILVAVTLASYLGARALSNTVIRGQASLIRTGLLDLSRDGPPDRAALEAKYEELGALGLGVRFIGVLSPEAADRVAIGSPSVRPGPEELHRYVDADVIDLGHSVQLVAPLFPSPPPGARPPGPDQPPPGPIGHLLVEFEPVARTEMLQRARWELAVGIAGGVVVLLISLGFWRLSLQAERAKQHLAEQRRLAALGEMSAVLAHELRNPLASLKGHAQLLVEQLERGRDEPERSRRKAARVVDEALRLERLSEGLLAFVRIGEVVREPASPAALVESAADELERERITITADAAPPAWALDGPRIRQVLTNLLDNALQAAPDAPVEVEVRASQATLEFCVRDRGPGIPAAERERIFEPFVTTRTRGTGLGLAISRRIVELHGGEIIVADNPDGGAELRVRLPARAGRSA